MQTSQSTSELCAGRYAFERTLGRGGVGEVFLARDMQLDRWVAIKRMHPSEGHAQTAISEARNLAALQHPNIVTVHDFVEDGEDILVVMEYVHGRTLEDITLRAPLTFEDFVEVGLQSLEGLAAAHSIGMLHRDIKPGNIMVATTSGGRHQVKILDFGLSKIAGGEALQTIDHTGSLVGSIHTMAPEQFEQRPLDARTDLYALGCVFYQALSGRMPFEGDGIAAVMSAHLAGRFAPLAPLRPDVGAAACAWAERLLAREMEDRPASAGEAAGILRAIVGGTRTVPTLPQMSPPSRPPSATRWILPVVAGIAGLGVSAYFLMPKSGPSPKAGPEASAPAPPAVPVFYPSAKEVHLAHVGREAVVEGVISRVGESKSGEVRYLNFVGTNRGDLSLVFFQRPEETDFTAENLSRYVGKSVRVRGVISEYKGAPQIQIASLDQITVTD